MNMAPSFRRSTGSGRTAPMDDDDEVVMLKGDPEKPSSAKQQLSVWERRRRRLEKKKAADAAAEPEADGEELKKSRRRSKNKDLPPAEEDEDLDPYDSDPGESYREHCMRLNGVGTRSCMAVPRFLKNRSKAEEDTVLTAPPSPMASEMGDLFGQIPASLPSNLARVRYSLRSSITDGSEKQPTGPSVMERRELRPNNIHLNVSHWSDEGGRPYMEDR